MFNLLFVASIISFSTLFCSNSRTWALSRHHCHRILPPRGLLAPYWKRRRREKTVCMRDPNPWPLDQEACTPPQFRNCYPTTQQLELFLRWNEKDSTHHPLIGLPFTYKSNFRMATSPSLEVAMVHRTLPLLKETGIFKKAATLVFVALPSENGLEKNRTEDSGQWFLVLSKILSALYLSLQSWDENFSDKLKFNSHSSPHVFSCKQEF